MIRRMLTLTGLALSLSAFSAEPPTPEATPDAAPTTAPSAEVKFSDAETRMWMTNQLQSVTRPVQIRYEFHKSGTFEVGFDDVVEFKVTKINADGSKAADLEFMTGERRFPVPPVDSTTVNPVLKIYLQGDVYEMNRLTDPNGSARERWRYFQRRIKLALAEAATVKATSIDFDGHKYSGYEISFSPYINDPKRDQFPRFADKHYSVIVSDDLPGYVYRIETVVPGPAGTSDPLLHEVLQLTTVKPAG